MNGKRRPDPAARLLSHALVGVAAGLIVGQRSGPGAAALSALIAIAAHQQLDAPMADIVAELGI